MNYVDVIMEALKYGDPDAEAFIRKILGGTRLATLTDEDVALFVSLRNLQKSRPKDHAVPPGKRL